MLPPKLIAWLLAVAFFLPHIALSQCVSTFKVKTEGKCSQSVIFIADIGTDAATNTYTWDFGDGTTGHGLSVQHQYKLTGNNKKTVTATLTVSNKNQNCSKQSSQSFILGGQTEVKILAQAGNENFVNCSPAPAFISIKIESSQADQIRNLELNWGDNTTSMTIMPSQLPLRLDHTFMKSGVTIMQLSMEDKNGCQTIIEQPIYIGTFTPDIVAQPAQDDSIKTCQPYLTLVELKNFDQNPIGTTYTVEFSDNSQAQTFSHPPPKVIYHTFTTSSCGKGVMSKPDRFFVMVTAKSPCGITHTHMADYIYVFKKPTAKIKFKQEEKDCQDTQFLFKSDSYDVDYYEPGQGCSGKPRQWIWTIQPDRNYSIIDGGKNQDHLSLLFSQPGKYRIGLELINDCGSSKVFRDIEVLGKPNAKFQLKDGATGGCAPYVAKIDNQSIGADHFEWIIHPETGTKFIKNTNQYSKEPVIQFLLPGDYKILLKAKNKCAITEKEITIKIMSGPSLSMLKPPDDCQAITLNPLHLIKGDKLSGNCSWTFIGGNPAQSNMCDPGEVTFSSPVNTIRLSTQSQCGAITLEETFHIVRPSSITISKKVEVCPFSDCINLNKKVKPKGGIWSGNVSANGIFCPSRLQPGKDYQAIYTIGKGNCQVRDTVFIHIKKSLNTNLITQYTVCESSPPFSLIKTNSKSHWQGTGVSNKGEFDPQKAGTGEHHLTGTIYDAKTQCSQVSKVVVTVVALSKIKLPPLPDLCANGVDINLSEKLGLHHWKNVIFSWKGKGIIDNQKGVFNSEGKHGEYHFSLEAKTQNGTCIKTFPIKVKVKKATSIQLKERVIVCISEQHHQLKSTPTGGIWQAISKTAPPINPQTGVIPLTFGGEFEYEYILDPGSSCESRARVTLQIIALPQIYAGPDQQVCEAETKLKLKGFFPATGRWDNPGIPFLDDYTVDIKSMVPGKYNLIYTWADTLPGCEVRDTMVLTIYEQPEANFISDGGCANNSVQFFSTYYSNATYRWDFGDGQTSQEANPQHFYSAGTYEVVLKIETYSSNGAKKLCTAKFTNKVTISDIPSLKSGQISVDPANKKNPVRNPLDNGKVAVDISQIGPKKFKVKFLIKNACGEDSFDLFLLVGNSLRFKRKTKRYKKLKNKSRQTRKLLKLLAKGGCFKF